MLALACWSARSDLRHSHPSLAQPGTPGCRGRYSRAWALAAGLLSPATLAHESLTHARKRLVMKISLATKGPLTTVGACARGRRPPRVPRCLGLLGQCRS